MVSKTMLAAVITFPNHFTSLPPISRFPLTKVQYRNYPAKPNSNLSLSLVSCANLIYKCCDSGAVTAARGLFDEMPERMISGYTTNCQDPNVWAVLRGVLADGAGPNEYTLSSVLKACKGLDWSLAGCMGWR